MLATVSLHIPARTHTQSDTVNQDYHYYHLSLVSLIQVLKYVHSLQWLWYYGIICTVCLPGFFVVWGWSPGFSVQLSRLLGTGRESTMRDPSMGEPIFVSGVEVVCWLVFVVGWMVVVVCWEVVVSLVVVGGMLVVNSVVGLMVVWAALVAAVVCWVVVGGAVAGWVGAGLLFESWKTDSVLTVAEDPGLFVGKVLVGGSWSVAVKEGKKRQFYVELFMDSPVCLLKLSTYTTKAFFLVMRQSHSLSAADIALVILQWTIFFRRSCCWMRFPRPDMIVLRGYGYTPIRTGK